MRSCDRTIRARRGTTSCPFAKNVFYGFWLETFQSGILAWSTAIPVYSPAVGRMFEVTCTDADTVICRGGDGAVVTFPRQAVTAFTVEDAVRYAATADLGTVPPPIPALPPDDVPKTPEGLPVEQPPQCHPSYQDACLQVDAGDYDCAGGSGNGPNYTGPVRVVGIDEFGLDRDGDGFGCE